MKCLDCIRHLPACPKHAAEMKLKEKSRSFNLALAVKGWRVAETGRVCVHRELESDEMGTRQAKAAQYLTP
jgi:hypothetical protein